MMKNKMASVRKTCVMRESRVFCQHHQMSTPSGFLSDGVDPFSNGVDKCHTSVLFTIYIKLFFTNISDILLPVYFTDISALQMCRILSKLP